MLLLMLLLQFDTLLATDPEINMSAPEIIRYWKYPVEEFDVTTADGYILKLFRIRRGLAKGIVHPQLALPTGQMIRLPACTSSSPGAPMLLGHGLGASSEHFLMNPPKSNPAFLLADAGFDVWLMNFRGSTYSHRHVKLTEREAAFWEFSWDEMAEFDLPAAVDFILRTTHSRKIYYTGHSQGTLVMFAKLSTDSSFGEKLHRVFALAPITLVENSRGPFWILRYVSPMLQSLERSFGAREFILPTQYLAWFAAKIICPWFLVNEMCARFVTFQGGPSAGDIFNRTRSPVYFAHYPGTSSLRTFAHWGQMMGSGRTHKYDYGSNRLNEIHYGRNVPPSYNFSKIRDVPLHLFWSENDFVSSAEDIRQGLLKDVAPRWIASSKEVVGYSHSDFVAGTTIKKGSIYSGEPEGEMLEIIDPIVFYARSLDGFKKRCR